MPQTITHRLTAAVSFSLVALLFAPTGAAAWCRASAEVSTSGECIQNPTAPLLVWKRACTAYAFNDALFDQLDGMNEQAVRAAFQAGFDAWAAVDCADRAAFLVEQRSETTSASASEYLRNGGNESVVHAIDPETWSTLPDHSPRAVAMTMVWHNRKTGEIVDTDIELNLGAGTFADCVTSDCRAGMVDLQNTVTHEAGHVLGLGHSTNSSATMAAQTVGTVDLQKRSLAPDDIEGYCALELPESQCSGSSCSCEQILSMQTSSATRGGCQVGTGEQGWLWLLAALGCASRTWRRARSRPTL